MTTQSQEFQALKLGLSDLINAFSTAIYVKDREHRCVMLNDACCRALGRARRAVVGKTDYDFLPKREADKIWRKEERLFADGGERSEEETLTNIKGVTRSYSTTKTLFTDRSGRAWLIGVMNDVTVHKEVLDTYRFMTSLLKAENEASFAGLLVVDDAGRVLTANRRFREIWGLSPARAHRRSEFATLSSLADQTRDPDEFRKAVNHLHRRRDEPNREDIALGDGRILDRYSSPVVDEGGAYYGRVWQFQDVTEVRKVEAMKAEVQRRRALDALKDQFIGTVSHELRTPLTIVRTAVDSLRGGVAGPLSPKQREVADLCSRNILRLSRMIANLLDISRLESGRAKVRLQRLELRPLLADMEANFRMRERGEGRESLIEIDAPEVLPGVRGDPELIGEVLYNLLDNAERFARKRVLVRVRRRRGRASGRDVDGVCVQVIDDGPGIPRERMSLLFNKFSQVERPVGGGYKGTGLGLAICKEILELHGTEIGVESAPGRGACFHFFLPEWPPKRPAPSARPAAGARA